MHGNTRWSMQTSGTGPPLFELHSDKTGSFYVQATWPDGHTNMISGFASANDARVWIENGSANWLRKVKHPSQDFRRGPKMHRPKKKDVVPPRL
jgi:hypothetical protein